MTHQLGAQTGSSAPVHPRATFFGALLAAAPLAGGLLAALAALGGRFGGGAEHAFTAFWYVAAAGIPLALAGILVLFLAHLHDRARLRLVGWAAVCVGGWVFGLGSAQVSGLAQGPEEAARPWQVILLAAGVATYLVGLTGLVAVALRAAAGRSGQQERGRAR